MNEDLRYPIGEFKSQPFSEKQLKDWIIDLQYLPQHLENAVVNLDELQLLTPYREAGWTIQQVIHHVADSHMNAYIRFKLALTENNPTIKPYDEVAWANLKDTELIPINVSLTLLHALHIRWCAVIKSITITDWERTVFHPGSNKMISVWDLLGMYAWHGLHHTAHITSLRERKSW